MNRLIAATGLLVALTLPARAGAQDPTPEPAPTPAVSATPAPAPANDAREAASTLAVPSSVRGTTVGATNEPNEPGSCNGSPTVGGVWYALDAPASTRDLVLELDAAGDLDAVVDVYRRDRSQLTPVSCAAGDRNGRVTLESTQGKGVQLLVRVAPLANSAADAFTLRVVAPDAPEPPPGRALATAGATGSVDRIANPDDAYAVSLKAGTSYRVRVVSPQRCVDVGLYPPGTAAFGSASPVRSLRCDDYELFTPGPGQGGRFSLRVQAPRNRRGALPYRIAVTRAGRDDTAPGVTLANGRRVAGGLAGADVVDLYRFAVTRRSTLDLRLKTSARFDLRVVSAGGKRLACACSGEGDRALRLTLKPGRYFAAVRSRAGAIGTYRLSRLTRTITALGLRVDRRLAPGAAATFAATVRPGAVGGVTFDVERLDPLAGWQFVTRLRRRAVAGRTSVTYTPPSVGRWRVRASFLGSRRFAPSGPKLQEFRVVEPVAEDD